MVKKKQKVIEEEEELGHASKSVLDSLGIKQCKKVREKHYPVYSLRWHPRETLDHVKYPSARWIPLENSPQFATWEKANKHCNKLQKIYKDKLYEACSQFIPKSEIPEKLLKEILSLPWYNKD